MTSINFENASFKDFENIPGQDIYATALEFEQYLNFLKSHGHLNYRIESLSPVGPEMNLMMPGDDLPTWAVCLVSKTPCAIAHGVVEVWPLESTP